MNTGELTAILREAGLSPYQADAYVTLLELGSISASDLATASGVPGPRIYDILRGLEDEGYVVTYNQDRLYARANDPAEALANLRTRVSRFEAAIEEVEDRWQQPETHEHEVTILRRFETVFEQTKRAIREADHYALLAVTPPQFVELRPALRDAHSRGLHVQIVIHPRPEEDVLLQDSEFEGTCAEARRTVPCRGKPFVALIDHQKAQLALNIGEPDEYGFLVDDPLHEHLLWFYLAGLLEIAEPIYTASEVQLPITFSEIRSCIQLVDPLLREQKDIRARVSGHRTTTNRPCTISGRISDVQYAGKSTASEPNSLFQLAGEASLVIESGEEVFTVGGAGAVLEEIEAERVVIEAISEQ